MLTKFTDNKRKAIDEPDAPKASKRVKNSLIASPEQEKRSVKVIPFPEKVSPGAPAKRYHAFS